MPVQEFECQIARGQIGRYLNGEGLSSEGLRHLGVHVAECPGCKKFLDQRKATLQGMLGETPMPEQESPQAVVGINPSEALIAQIRARTGEGEPEPEPARVAQRSKPIITKPIMFCGALALVLVGMTYVSHNMTGFLGQNAAQAIAAKAPTTPLTPAVDTKPTPATAKPTTVGKPTDAAAAKTADANAAKTTTPAEPTATTPDDNKTPHTDATATGATGSAGDAKAPATSATDKNTARPGIEPTAKQVASPISIAPTMPQLTGPKPATKGAAKTKAKAARGHRPWRAHRKGGLYNLKPGTAAIHIYSQPQ